MRVTRIEKAHEVAGTAQRGRPLTPRIDAARRAGNDGDARIVAQPAGQLERLSFAGRAQHDRMAASGETADDPLEVSRLTEVVNEEKNSHDARTLREHRW